MRAIYDYQHEMQIVQLESYSECDQLASVASEFVGDKTCSAEVERTAVAVESLMNYVVNKRGFTQPEVRGTDARFAVGAVLLNSLGVCRQSDQPDIDLGLDWREKIPVAA